MVVRRVLALLLAAGLVLAAVVLRTRLLEGGTTAADDLRLVCVRELAAVCERLGTPDSPPMVEDAATTVTRFERADAGLDVWVTIAPWPTLAADARARAGLAELPSAASDVLARSPVLLAARSDRTAVLQEACAGGELTWRCIGDHADDEWADLGGQAAWGRVKVGFDQPTVRPEGLLALSQATSSFFDGQPYNSRSLSAPDYFAWVSELGRAIDDVAGQTPLERMLLTGAADYELTGVLEATAAPLLRSAPQRSGDIELRDIGPAVTADVVAVGYGEVDRATVRELSHQVATASSDAGWRVPGSQPPSELDARTLPDDNGLPSAGALEALRQTWIEVTR